MGQPNNISQLPASLHSSAPSSSITMTDNYNTNVTMVYNDESIDSIKLQRGAAKLCRRRPEHPKPGILSRRVGVKGGTALPRVLRSEREGRQDPLGARCSGQAQAEGGRPEHLLWALYFMKVYPKQGPGCSVVGTSAGVVDLKTHRKWVGAYVEAIAELVNVVVSLLYFLRLFIDLLLTATVSKGHRRRRTPSPSTG